MSEIQTIVDTVPETHLRSQVNFTHTGDPTAIIDNLNPDRYQSRGITVSPQVIQAIQPPLESVTADSIPIDFEALLADARGQEGDRFKYIIRGANRFDVYRSDKDPDQFEADAVNLLGPDMSLYLHGAHQGRRVERLMVMQQMGHRRVFGALHTAYGNTEDTVAGYRKFSTIVPNFGLNDVKYGILCGFLHDYGEAKMGIDKPLNEKRDPLYNIIERANAVAFAQEIHVPFGSSDWDILKRRYLSECHGASSPDDEELARVSAHLYKDEVSRALMGTEGQVYGNVERGEAFEAVERLEYILTALRCFEACEHDRQNIRQDPYLNQEILWLGIDSIINSLQKLTEVAEKYVAVYDFLAFNEADLDHYLGAVNADIDLREAGDGDLADTVFGMDPFIAFKPGHSHHNISATYEQARGNFRTVTEHWQKWRKRHHIVRDVWEAFVGTDHAMGAEQEDLTFLHYTTRRRRKLSDMAGRIAISLPIEDQFGVGLDPEVRRLHEESIYT